MATGSQWKFGADASEYKRVVREMPSEMDKAAAKIEGRTKQMSGNVSRFMGELGSLIAGGAIVSGLTNLLKKMDDISDGARRIGISTVEFQKIGNAAELVGTSVEAVNKAMIRVGVAANKAAREGGDMAKAFARASLDPAKFAAAGLEERIKMVAEAQRAANGDAQKMSELFEAIGVKAAGIDFASLAEEMSNVSAASDDTVQALARANDELDKAKQNATIFGANLLKGISDASERLGSILGGGSGQTMAEIDAQIARDNAIAALRAKGQLLPDDSQKVAAQDFAMPDPTGDGFPIHPAYVQDVFGPNSQENERRIAAEIKAQEELNKAKEQEAKLARETAASETEQLSKTEQKAQQEAEIAKFKQYMLEIDLKIKEAQAAGDKEREAQLNKLKDWTEAAIKYEGDFDMAARDVNATLKERNRLREQELAKQRASIEAELKHVETMTFGTEEAKAKAEWMDEYNRRLGQGATDEEAKRFANAATYKPQQEMSYGGGGGGGGGGDGGVTFGPSVSGAPMSENMRVADLRGKARQATHYQRASDLAARGMFRSAVRNLDAGQRAYDREMRNAEMRDKAASFDFAGRKAGNVGEALSGIQDKIGGQEMLDRMRNAEGYDPSKGETTNMKNAFGKGVFDDAMRHLAKTPEERKKEEEDARNRSRPPGGGGDRNNKPDNQSVDGKLDRIVKLMEERLPIRVLAKAA